MTSPIHGSQRAVAPAPDARDQLRRLAHDLESVFLGQLFQAMRSTVPESGLMEKPPGEEMFTALLDERLASAAAQRFHRGLGEALYRQLSRGLAPPPGEPGGK